MQHRVAALKAAAERRQAELKTIALYGGSAESCRWRSSACCAHRARLDALAAAGKRRALKTVVAQLGPMASIR